MLPSPAAFPVLGHLCSLTNAPEHVERWLRSQWESSNGIACSGPLIDVVFHDGALSEDTAVLELTRTTIAAARSLDWRRHAARRWSTHQAEGGLDLALSETGAQIGLWVESGTPVGDSLYVALHVAICEALRARAFVPLHAAVVTRDGQATAFLGQSGAGKSTTLLAAIDAGWLPLAEDFAWLDLATGRVHGWGGDRGVRLTADGYRRLPARWQRSAWLAGHGKILLEYRSMCAPRVMSAELTRLVVLHRDTARRSVLESLTRREAVRVIWECAGVPLCPISRAAFSAEVPRLLSRLESSRLVIGWDLLPL